MSDIDIIKDLARKALIVSNGRNAKDRTLWDRGQRLARNVGLISKLPEVADTSIQIDNFCLLTATYFSETGLAQFLSEDESDANAILISNNEEMLDMCAKIVDKYLSRVLDNSRVAKINAIITESSGRVSNRFESMILSDARNLDDMGAVGIFNELRQYIISGKSVSDALKIWKRKIDYQYWQARLKEGFRFDSVRKLAEQRLAAAEYFMKQLEYENTAEDLEQLQLGSNVA